MQNWPILSWINSRIKEKPHTCEEGGAHLIIFVQLLFIKSKNNHWKTDEVAQM